LQGADRLRQFVPKHVAAAVERQKIQAPENTGPQNKNPALGGVRDVPKNRII
jgi:hypothetical protein